MDLRGYALVYKCTSSKIHSFFNKKIMQTKRIYQSPSVTVIKLDLRESLMLLPQSQQGTTQMSPPKNGDYGSVSWDEDDQQEWL